MSKTHTVTVADGGRLITALSLENVGEANWARKLNMRRGGRDREVRQEGWVAFVGDDQYEFDGTESVLRLAELVRPNGDRVIVGASRTKLKKYDTATTAWVDISGGLTFSASGKRWQVDKLNGYLILNNTVDLPVSYRVEDAAVTQMAELRQVGVASVGRIRQYNGYLLLADVTEIKADQLDPWMNGYASYTTTATETKNANFSVTYATDGRKLFEVTTGASTITVTLPSGMAFDDRPFYFWLKKVDAGAGSVVTSPVIADQVVSLTAVNDMALIWWNGNKWVATVFSGGTIPATAPYGTPPAAITQRIPYEVITGEFGEPTKWAPLFDALMPAASTKIVLPFVPSTWVANQTRVAVIGGGPEGATLGGQPGYEDGILITAIGAFDAAKGGVEITLEVTTDTGLTYPLEVQVTRWTDVSSIVARYLLQDDGSAIIGMEKLQRVVVLYRTTCIYVGRYTGDVDNPFVFEPMYPGEEELNLPIWGDAIATVNGEYHLFPGNGGRFYKFDGVSWPQVHHVCDDAADLLFTGVKTTDEVFCVTNFATKQVWFCTPVLTFAYDTEFGSVSEIDAVIGAGCFCLKPGGTDQWFILAIGKNVFTYGLVTGVTPIHTWLRDEVVGDVTTWAARAAAQANAWLAIAWSPELGIFAAVSQDGTNRVMTSPDGITWTARAAAEANIWDAIAWSPELGLFAAVSSNGTNRVMTSPDGITWTARAAAEANVWTGIAWSPELGLFAAVSSTGTNRVMTSPDGITWTARAAASASQWTAIAWSSELGLFAAVAQSDANRVMTSANGIAWTARTAAEANGWQSIAWSPELGLFAAVSNTGTNRVMTSPNGITWTARAAAEANSWKCVTWSPELWLFAAVSNTGTNRVMTSPDGITWTARAAASANQWWNIAWSPELGVFAAISIDGANRVMTSTITVIQTAPSAVLKSGLISAGLMAEEKTLLNYTPVVGSSSGNAEFTVMLRSTYNPSGTLTDLFVAAESLPDPAGQNFLPTYFQAIFFQDEITLVEDTDIDFQLTQRIFEFDRVGDARGITRAKGYT
jgi:hypothetical protein